MLNAVSWKLNDDTDRITIKQPKKTFHYHHITQDQGMGAFVWW